MVTPQIESPEIAAKLGLDKLAKLFFKREDLHPYGSHKGRSIPMMIDMKVAEGAKDFAISSSGNAAFAAVRHIQKRNAAGDHLTLTVLTGEKINQDKLKSLKAEITDPHISLQESPRPLQALFNLIKSDGKTSLRQSTDPEALIGYKNLAAEIAFTPELAAVFIGTSSGTTAQALADYFVGHAATVGDRIPQIHIVQTSSIFPIASAVASTKGDTIAETIEPETSLADAIVDKVAHRADAVAQAIIATQGAGWIATNADILEAQALLRDLAHIDVTPNGALGLAGLLHALRRGAKFDGAVVCVVTGK